MQRGAAPHDRGPCDCEPQGWELCLAALFRALVWGCREVEESNERMVPWTHALYFSPGDALCSTLLHVSACVRADLGSHDCWCPRLLILSFPPCCACRCCCCCCCFFFAHMSPFSFFFSLPFPMQAWMHRPGRQSHGKRRLVRIMDPFTVHGC